MIPFGYLVERAAREPRPSRKPRNYKGHVIKPAVGSAWSVWRDGVQLFRAYTASGRGALGEFRRLSDAKEWIDHGCKVKTPINKREESK